MFLGASYVSGIFSGERLTHYVTDKNALIWGWVIILMVNIVMKTVDLSPEQIYIAFVMQTYFLGIAFNLMVMI